MSWRQRFDIHGDWLILGLIMLSALTLRVWGIGFGLPYSYHFDEHYYINTALKLGTGVINNPPYAPTGLSNLLFGEYAIYYVIGRLSGIFASAQEFESAFRHDPSIFYLLGRVTSALLGTVTCLMLYMLGKAVHNPTGGLVAAGFLAISFQHVRDSHYAVPDAAVTYFVTLALALAFVGVRSNKRRHIYLAALSGGLAVAMKWTATPVVLAVGWASLWLGHADNASIAGRLLSRTMMLTIFFFALGFALGSPQILLNPVPYINEGIALSKAGRAGGFIIWQVDTLPGWLFYGKALLIGVGPILFILGVAGIFRRIILTVKTGDKMGVLLLVFPGIYYLLMGSTRNYFARYSLPLAPFIALFAAEMIIFAATWTATNRWGVLRWAVPAMLITGAIAQPLINSIRHDVLLTRKDTRTLAKDWIEAHIPSEAKIAVDSETHSPPISTQDRAIPYSRRVYDVTVVGWTGLSDHSLTWYREHGFDYLVASSFIYALPLLYEGRDAERQAFYTLLDQDVRLVQEFHPFGDEIEAPFVFDEIYGPIVSLWQRERPGPTIKIYKLDQQPSK